MAVSADSNYGNSTQEEGASPTNQENDEGNTISITINLSFQDSLNALDNNKPILIASIKEFLSKYENEEFYSKLVSENGLYGEYGVSECGFDLYCLDSKVSEAERNLREAISSEISENEKFFIKNDIYILECEIQTLEYDIQRINIEIDTIKKYGRGDTLQKKERVEKKEATRKRKQETKERKQKKIETLKEKLEKGPIRNEEKEEKLRKRLDKAIAKRDSLIEKIKRTNFMTTY